MLDLAKSRGGFSILSSIDVSFQRSITPDQLSILEAILNSIVNYCKALKISPGYLEVQSQLNNTIEELKKTNASALCQAPLEIEPAYYHSRKGLEMQPHYDFITQGNECLKAGDSRKALTVYNQVHQALVDRGVLQEGGRHRYYIWSVEGLYNRAVILQSSGHLEEAITAYTELAKWFPVFPIAARAWYNRGVALESLNCLDEAVASYREAVNLAPLYPAAWYRQGVFLKSFGNLDEAITSLEKAMYISQKFGNQQIATLTVKALESSPS